MIKNEFLSVSEAAKILGISRVAVFKKIQNGKIRATKVGRNYIIAKKDLGLAPKTKLTEKNKREISVAVKKAVREYGEIFRLLAQH